MRTHPNKEDILFWAPYDLRLLPALYKNLLVLGKWSRDKRKADEIENALSSTLSVLKEIHILVAEHTDVVAPPNERTKPVWQVRTSCIAIAENVSKVIDLLPSIAWLLDRLRTLQRILAKLLTEL